MTLHPSTQTPDPPMPLRLLVIEDDPADYLLLRRHLDRQGLAAECRRVDDDAALDAALSVDWDLVLADFNVPGMSFRESLARIRARCPGIPVILVSGSVGEETAVELLHLGVCDFLLKDSLGRLAAVIQRCLDAQQERRARQVAEASLRQSQTSALKAQQRARLAALSLMEDAVNARRRAEDAQAALAESRGQVPPARRARRGLHLLDRVRWVLQVHLTRLRGDHRL